MTQLHTRVPLLTLLCGLASSTVLAEDFSLSNPSISAILNGYYQTGARPLAESPDGFGLGETELALSANIDDMFYGKVTTVVELGEGHAELNVEEAFIQTTAMPAGFSMRAGRFLSDIGYLNNQHLHTDSFTDRPIVYRAFLGNHYFDEGVRVDYVAPTDLYWSLGMEALKGNSLRAERADEAYQNVGVYTFYSKIGGDIGVASSWQVGLSYLRNQNGQIAATTSSTNISPELAQPYGEHDDHSHAHNDEHSHSHAHNDEHSHDDSHHDHMSLQASHSHSHSHSHDHMSPQASHSHSHEHSHSHSAAFTGKNIYGIDFVYKWAPDGNYKYQNLTLSGEWFRVTGFVPANLAQSSAPTQDYHQGWYVSGVYQFAPSWSAGLRFGTVDTQALHGDHFHAQNLTESEASVAWHPSHFSTVRMQYTYQDSNQFDGVTDNNIITLQYIMSLGAHGAHQF